jgi:hypothetical protein
MSSRLSQDRIDLLLRDPGEGSQFQCEGLHISRDSVDFMPCGGAVDSIIRGVRNYTFTYVDDNEKLCLVSDKLEGNDWIG